MLPTREASVRKEKGFGDTFQLKAEEPETRNQKPETMKSYSTNPLNLDQSPSDLLKHIREELDAMFRENKIPLSAALTSEPWVLKPGMSEPPPPVTRLCLFVEDSAGEEVRSWPGGVDVPSTDNAEALARAVAEKSTGETDI